MLTPILIVVIAVVVLVAFIWLWTGRFNKRQRLDKEFREVFGFSSPERDAFRVQDRRERVFKAIYQAGMELAEARAMLKRYGSRPGVAIHYMVIEEKEGTYRRLRKLARNAGYSQAFLSDIDTKARHGVRSKEEAAPAQPIRSV